MRLGTRGGEARAQRAAVAAVLRMRDDAQSRAELGEFVEHFGRAVAAAVGCLLRTPSGESIEDIRLADLLRAPPPFLNR